MKPITMKSKPITTIWINNEKPIWKVSDIEKPCRRLGFCPYGGLVEEYPLRIKRDGKSCKTFGHDCPIYYQGEYLCE